MDDGAPSNHPAAKSDSGARITRSDAEWQRLLTPEQYRVLRQQGTERAFTGEFWNNHADGTYLCAGCGEELFRSAAKFDSGTGWPSFTAPAEKGAVETEVDDTHGMVRTEVHCRRCGGHLGHRFPDGPAPTGQRYCINSASLRFRAATGGHGKEAPRDQDKKAP
ncbi:MAG: peptide-methionine (R)-S-oxide reductase MsrB [Planctomycetes bacterium]|nr:peptide-methionine (R)-S-oxide reductase MsrB [Planctomycetota bacterium]MCB9872463.1 peptide-methionine (R)-S-oxide reductase MsrB [Planctomycetota bacterium]